MENRKLLQSCIEEKAGYAAKRMSHIDFLYHWKCTCSRCPARDVYPIHSDPTQKWCKEMSNVSDELCSIPAYHGSSLVVETDSWHLQQNIWSVWYYMEKLVQSALLLALLPVRCFDHWSICPPQVLDDCCSTRILMLCELWIPSNGVKIKSRYLFP